METKIVIIKSTPHTLELINEIWYYKNEICQCSCGEQIRYRKRHDSNGKPNYLPNHYKSSEVKRNKIIVFNEIEYYENLICKCGCGQKIPVYSKNCNKYYVKPKYIKGHCRVKKVRKYREEFKITEELMSVSGIMYYKNRICKCGCGKSIMFRCSDKRLGVPNYIGNHWLRDEEYLNRMRNDVLKQLSQKGSYGQIGYFYSAKNSKSIPYDSSYELKAMNVFEEDPKIISYERNSVKIPYEVDGKIRNYFPDFKINYIGLSVILEVKPIKFINSTKNLLKFSAARDFCSAKGLIFEVWTEKDLGIRKNGSYIP